MLDPACGSGNFLYLALKTLKDIEHSVHVDIQTMELDRPVDLVTSPANVLGIELNEYAAELARVTVWIGELQWRLQHGYPFKQNPVLEPLDHIECRDALLAPVESAAQVPSPAARERAEGEGHDPAKPTLIAQGTALTPTLSRTAGEGAKPAVKFTKARWPRADAVIGNPPFVGDKKMRSELGDEYTETLRKVYEGRVPGGADLVCYWFEKARDAIKNNRLSVAGLVSTNSIRGGKNRFVLDAIVESARIFEAWSDEPWVNDGAAVRVSLVAFGAGSGSARLDGSDVDAVSADLSATSQLSDAVNLTHAARLGENSGACFMGVTKVGPFDIPAQQARSWLTRPNPNGKSNGNVLRPSWNGLDLTRRQREMWIVDFGADMTRAEASLYEAPYEFADKTIKPFRETNNREAYRRSWWIHGEARPGLRRQISGVLRFIATPEVAKHRVFVWCLQAVLPDKNLQCTPRADDTTFGILHSRFHELWSLRMCTWMGVGNDPRYTPTTCFETFPFPAGLTPRDTAHQRTEVLADGAVIPAFSLPSPAARERVPDRAGEGDGLAESTLKNQSTALTPTLSRAAGEGVEQASVVNDVRDHAIAIARAAKRLNDLRERWLNPPEWTEAVPEVIPLGMETSPYPDRILPRANLGAADLAELKKRTLTNLYNQRPAWLADAHAALDSAVAAAYGWADYSPATTDNEILARLLALNHERAASV